LFFFGFEWRGIINIKIVTDHDELINEDDYNKFKAYFLDYKPETLNYRKTFIKIKQKLISGFKYLHFKKHA